MKIVFLFEQFNHLKALIAKAAQNVYNCWEQEDGYSEEYGSGGICDDIASEIANIISNNTSYEATTHYNEYDYHTSVWVADKTRKRLWNIDIHPSFYEQGSAYTWKKLQDVIFSEDMISISDESYLWDEFIDKNGDWYEN